MAIDPESLYLQLGQLVSEMPELGGKNPLTSEDHLWLGRITQLIRDGGDSSDWSDIKIAINFLTGTLRDANAQQVKSIIFRTLAKAEANAPVAAKGMFVAVGATFSALQAIGKVMSQATHDLLIVDAYMDSTVLTDFVSTATEGVKIRLLSDSFHTRPDDLNPAVTRWCQQHRATRPIEARLTSPRALHDRLIVVDKSVVWDLSQSIKDFAKRSPATVHRMDASISEAKIEFYEQSWEQSTVLA